jgi:hypothetical protein
VFAFASLGRTSLHWFMGNVTFAYSMRGTESECFTGLRKARLSLKKAVQISFALITYERLKLNCSF